MVLKDLRELLPEDSLVFDNPSFDGSIIGISNSDTVVYSYERMVQELMEDEEMDELDAREFIDYNTLRALPYFGDNAPIVVMDIDGYGITTKE